MCQSGQWLELVVPMVCRLIDLLAYYLIPGLDGSGVFRDHFPIGKLMGV